MTDRSFPRVQVTVAVTVLLLALASSSLAGPAAGGTTQPPRLIEFEIEDQFGTRHSDGDVRDVVLVAIAAGRKGREHAAPWGDAVREALASQLQTASVAVLPIADLRGVPGFVRKRVRSKFPQEPERWVLMDWKGRFAQAFELPEEGVSVLLFGIDGALVTRMTGVEVNDAQVAHLSALVREMTP